MKVLIVEGNTKKDTHTLFQNGCRNYVEIFSSLLKRWNANCIVNNVNPNELTEVLPSIKKLNEYNGIIWTGSLLSTYDNSPEVNRQLEFANTIFQAGVPFYGSCFGMQLAVVAAGGNVSPCAKGIEIGITQPITMTDLGRKNALLHNRKNGFQVLCVHGDEVSKLPSNSHVLAYNSHSKVQSIEIYHLNGKFNGVQYHPEFTLNDLIGIYNTAKEWLLRLSNYGGEIHFNKEISKLSNANQLSNEITDYKTHSLEVNNWLNSLKIA